MLLSYYRRPLFLLLLAYAGGIWLFRGFFLKPAAALPFALPRCGVLIEGRLAEYPAAGAGGTRVQLETTAVYRKPLKTRLMVYARSLAGASYGDKVAFIADLEAPPGASAPGSLDWADYLSRRGITAQARAYDVEVAGRAGPWLLLARKFRCSALGAFERALPPEEASVLGGVVLGEKKSVPPGLKAAFQDSGAMHLLVASGSNVGFVVAVVYFFCSRLGLKRKYSGLAALALSGFYVTASGFDAPLVRAYLMFAAGLGAWLLRREAGAFHALTAACFAILAFSPRSLFDAGFQMSFLAAYGLCAGLSAWGKYLPAGIPGRLSGLVLVSFFAQLGLYPLLALYFHKLSLVSLLSNMLLVPASGVAMGLGFLLAFFSGAGPVFGWLASACGAFMWLFLRTVRFFAALPFSSVYVAEPSAWFVGGFFILAFAVLHAPLFGFRGKRLCALSLAGLGVMSAGPLTRAVSGPPPSYRTELFGDGNTACALVRYGGKKVYLVNPGLGGKKLADAVFSGGGRTVDWVLLTSLEEKNFSGLEKLAEMTDVRNVLLPYGPRPAALRRVLAGLEKRGCRVARAWPGESPAAGAPAAFREGGGYAGAGELVGWEIGPLRVGGEGRYAEGKETGGSGRARVDAQPRKTVTLEWPADGEAEEAGGGAS